MTEGMGRVRVHRVTYTENTARETVPYETEYLDETAESTGKYSHEVLVQAGQDGLVDVTYRQKYVDGGYSSTEVVDTQVVTEMIPEIYRKYNSDAVSPAAGPRGHHGGKQRAQQLQQNVFHEGDRLLFRPRTRRQAAWACITVLLRATRRSFPTVQRCISPPLTANSYMAGPLRQIRVRLCSPTACRWTCSTRPMPNPWQTA